ncbi:MAG: hypothetical protein ACPGJE_00175 [Wenzhouxiangellaceae bacterium]
MIGWLTRPERNDFALLRAAASTISLAGLIGAALTILMVVFLGVGMLTGYGMAALMPAWMLLLWLFLASLALVVLGQFVHLIVGFWRERRRIGGN